MSTKHYEEGETCPECGNGTLRFEEPENCSCHISAPCHAHTTSPLVCSECREESHDEQAAIYVQVKVLFDCYSQRHRDPTSYVIQSAEIDHLYEVDNLFGWYGDPYPDDYGQVFFARKINPFQLNWVNLTHSNASMIKLGWAPPWVSQEAAREKLNGTFGGRFIYFRGNGQFEFIAYTD